MQKRGYRPSKTTILLGELIIAISLGTCNMPALLFTQNNPRAISTSVAHTVQAEAFQKTMNALPAILTAGVPATQPVILPDISQTTDIASLMTANTTTVTTTPLFPTISAKIDTNCREGPLPDYKIVGSLLVGETAEVHGRNSTSTWWYIQNIRKPGQFCWVWGETTTVTGDTSQLPILTPQPLPATLTPSVTPTVVNADFTISFVGTPLCGGNIVLTFAVKNTGEVPLESLEAFATNVSNLSISSSFSDLPFLATNSQCPPGGDQLNPGESAFTFVELGIPPDQFTSAYDIAVTLCTQEGRIGKCVSKLIGVPSP